MGSWIDSGSLSNWDQALWSSKWGFLKVLRGRQFMLKVIWENKYGICYLSDLWYYNRFNDTQTWWQIQCQITKKKKNWKIIVEYIRRFSFSSYKDILQEAQRNKSVNCTTWHQISLSPSAVCVSKKIVFCNTPLPPPKPKEYSFSMSVRPKP